jgi:hypothetical protein
MSEKIDKLEKRIRTDAESYRSTHNRYAEDAVEVFDSKDLVIQGLRNSAADFLALIKGVIGDGFLFNASEDTICPVCGRQPQFNYADENDHLETTYLHAEVCELAIALELPRGPENTDVPEE